MSEAVDQPLPALGYNVVAQLYRRIYGIKSLKRTGWVTHGLPDPESVADHSFGVALLTLVFAPRLGLDVGKALTIALLHDLAESLVGDITPADGVEPGDKTAAEEVATRQILSDVDPDGALFRLWQDFEYQRSPEGVLVKQLDRLEMAFQAHEYEARTGKRLDEFYAYVEKRLHAPALVRLFDELVEARGE